MVFHCHLRILNALRKVSIVEVFSYLCYYYKSFTTQPFSGKEGSEFGRNGTHRRRCEQIRFAVSVFVDSDPLRTLHAP